MDHPKPASRAALHELLDTLREIDEQYYCERRGITSRADIAEGEHHLTHLLRAGFDLYLENDPDRPRFSQIITPSQKLGGDGPDHHVFFAPLDGRRSYRIRGRRTGEVYLSFTVHTTDGEGGWATGVVSDLNDRAMAFGPDGSYEIVLSQKRQPGNWLALVDDASALITRHYFQNERAAVSDPDVRPVLDIDPLEPAAPPLPLGEERLARKLRAVTRYVRGHTLDSPVQSAETVPEWFSLVPNQLPRPRIWQNADGGGFGAVDNAYTAAPFALGPEEALVMEGRIPKCCYANVCLWNRYFQTFDHRYRQIGLNQSQMELDANGRFRIAIAHRDPGLRNWLDTEGRPSGIIYWRFLLPEEEIEQPQCTVVKLSEIARS